MKLSGANRQRTPIWMLTLLAVCISSDRATALTVEGTVTNQAGEPLERVYVFDGRERVSLQGDHATVTTDEEGRFKLEGLPSEVTQITAVHHQYAPATNAISAEGQETVEVDFALVPGATLTGMVTVGGEPVPHATINVSVPDAGYSNRAFGGDADGRYEKTGLPAGTARLSYYGGDNPRRGRDAQIVLEEGETHRLDLTFPHDNAVLQGQVIDEGEPIPEARLNGRIVLASGERESFHGNADEAGNFHFENLPAGDFGLRVNAEIAPGEEADPTQAPELLHRFVSARLMPNSTTTFNVEMTGGHTLAGQVRGLDDATGASAVLYTPDVDLTGYQPEDMGQWNQLFGDYGVAMAMADAEGVFSFEHVQAGTYRIVVVSHDPGIDNIFMAMPTARDYVTDTVEVTETGDNEIIIQAP